MPKTVLLSIKPEFADKILNGKKRFEFRRALFRDTTITKVVLYASYPVCKIIGEFDIEEILSMSMTALWRKTREDAGISWQVFSEYFVGKQECHAIRISNPKRYKEPLRLNDAFGLVRPPQSFTYVDWAGEGHNRTIQ